MFFEKKIFLIGIKVCMLRVCRVKYFERLSILICNKNDEELFNMMFKNMNDMVIILEIFVKIKDLFIRYIDIMILGVFVKVIVYLF